MNHPIRTKSPLRRVTVAAGAAALALTLTMAGASAANAAPLAPSCVKVIGQGRTWAGMPKVTIRNDCSTTKRVKIVWAGTPDSGCNVLSRGEKASDWTGLIGKFAGLQLC